MAPLTLPSCASSGVLQLWASINPTASKPPFSFYHFREQHGWNTTAFCRLFSQWRQNGGVHSIAVEKIQPFAESQREDATLLRVLPGRFQGSQLFRLTAYNTPCPPNKDISALPENACVGFCIIKENLFTDDPKVQPVVFESVTPHNRHPSSFPTCAHDYRCMPQGRPFTVTGLYYCQQNGISNVCVHAALKMLCYARRTAVPVTYHEIDGILGTVLNGPNDMSHRHRRGLSARCIENFLQAKNIRYSQSVYRDDNQKGRPFIPSRFPFYKYLYASVEMGCPALLVFRSSTRCRHVVTVLGHTFNEDAYRPIAEVGYNRLSRKLGYMPSESWTSNFIVHDDNFGGEHCLPVHYLNPLRVSYVVGTLPPGCIWDPKEAELRAMLDLYSFLDLIKGTGGLFGPWYRRLNSARSRMAVAFRTVHISRNQYIQQLESPQQSAPIWPVEKPTPVFLKRIANELPASFYAVEFSLPDIFSANRRKLGEVLLRCDKVPTSATDPCVMIAARAPGILFMPNGNKLWPEIATGINSHLPLLNARE